MNFDPLLILFWAKKLVSVLVLPPLLPFALILAGLVLLGRRPGLGKGLAWLGLAVGMLLITPASVGWLLAPLEPDAPLNPATMREAQAIVVLGGGRMSNAPEYGDDTVNRYTLERLRYAARLARQSGLPVLVSGGAPSGDVPEAVLMQTTLEEDFGVTPRWSETESLDTRQNARYSAAQLQADGVGRIVLVTHAAHMRRARAEFEARGLHVIAAPTAWQGPRPVGAEEEVWPALPSPASAYAGWYALHEWLGLLAYRLTR